MAEKKKKLNTDWIDVTSNFAKMAGSMTDGYSQWKASKAMTNQLYRSADSVEAMGTRQAIEVARQGERAKSNAQALNAAMGGGMDPAMIERMARLEGDKDYNVMSTLFQSDEQAAKLRYQARIEKRRGKSAMINGLVGAVEPAIGFGKGVGPQVGSWLKK